MSIWSGLTNKAKALTVLAGAGTLIAAALIGAATATITLNRNYEDWQKIRETFNRGQFILVDQEIFLEIRDDGKVKRLQVAESFGGAATRNIHADSTPQTERSTFVIKKNGK